MASWTEMTAEQALEAAKSFSFEQFWAALNREAAERQRETAERKKEAEERQKEADKRQKEADKRQKEADKRQMEADRRHAEWQMEAAERQKEADKRLKELERVLTERHAETERVLKETAEQMKENDRKFAEMSAKTDRRLDRLSQNIGGLSHSMGEFTEALVASRLWEKFEIYHLDRGFQRVPVYDDNKRAVAEIDILLSNTDFAMVVEVKTSLNKMEYVDRHVERMELVRRYPPAEVAINGKRVMGALAGGVVSPTIMEYAHRCGFYVLELSGESVRLAEPPAGFKPKVW